MWLDERLADPAGLDAWVRAELGATAGGHADLAGALIVYRVAGHLAELTVGCLQDQRRALPLTPATVALRLGDAARLDGMAVVGAHRLAAGRRPCRGVAGTRGRPVGRGPAGGGRRRAGRGVRPAGRRRAGPGAVRAPGHVGTLADHLAEVAVRRARERGRAPDAALAEAERLVDARGRPGPDLRTRPRRQVVSTARGPPDRRHEGHVLPDLQGLGPARRPGCGGAG